MDGLRSEPADNDIATRPPFPRNLETSSDKAGTASGVLVAFPPEGNVQRLCDRAVALGDGAERDHARQPAAGDL